MDIYEATKAGDFARVRELLVQTPSLVSAGRADGLRIIHLAVINKKYDVLQLILKDVAVRIDVADADGNTALHHAARLSDLESVRTLLAFGANPATLNNANKRPVDIAKDAECLSLLNAKVVEISNARLVQQARIDFLKQIEAELPGTGPGLRTLILEMLASNQTFQDRCRAKIRELIKEKHQAWYKYRLLENAAGLLNKGNYQNQLQEQQHLNEEQAATISYLQIQNAMNEPAVHLLDEFYRKTMTEMSEYYAQNVKQVNDILPEAEKKFAASRKNYEDDLERVKKENLDLKTNLKSSLIPASDAIYFQKVQNENLALQQRLKGLQSDRASVAEKLKSVEQLKSLHEKEITKIRNDTSLHRKLLQDTMGKVLNESKTESDEKDESSGQIVFIRGENGSKQVKGATPEKLVERLCIQNAFDSQYQAAFLLTFRSFITANAVFDILVKRYRESDVELNPSITAQSAANPVHLRVCKVIKSWIESFWSDFQNNQELTDKLNAFITEIEQSKSKLAPLIRTALLKKQSGRDDQAPVEKTSNEMRPKPILPKALARKERQMSETQAVLGSTATLTLTAKPSITVGTSWNNSALSKGKDTKFEELNFKLADLDPLEVARQLTLIEYHLFTAIKPDEFLDQAWMKEDKEIKAPNICEMTQWSNRVTRWIVSEIVTVKDSIKNRAATFERIVAIAHHLEKMNNFNGVKEILAALQSSSVYRLKKTQELLGNKYAKLLDNLLNLNSIEMNFRNLRTKVHGADPPLIPFPGIYQSDLVFMDTCNKSKLEGGLVNFMKYQKIASYILELQVYQQTPYNFEYVPEIADYIRLYPVLDEDESYKDSLICEPRGS
eukprot:Partr_v1_DN27709_c1_g1_i1_m67015 putative Son of sevenless homolog